MFLLSPLFEPLMSMPSSTINWILPVDDRKDGTVLDASVNNPDMARNFELYEIESLQAPTLIITTKDDKLAKYEQTEKAVIRFPNSTFISFETGGHLLEGNSDETNKVITEFLKYKE